MDSSCSLNVILVHQQMPTMSNYVTITRVNAGLDMLIISQLINLNTTAYTHSWLNGKIKAFHVDLSGQVFVWRHTTNLLLLHKNLLTPLLWIFMFKLKLEDYMFFCELWKLWPLDLKPHREMFCSQTTHCFCQFKHSHNVCWLEVFIWKKKSRLSSVSILVFHKLLYLNTEFPDFKL